MINDINQTKKQDQASQKQIPFTQTRVKTPIQRYLQQTRCHLYTTTRDKHE